MTALLIEEYQAQGTPESFTYFVSFAANYNNHVVFLLIFFHLPFQELSIRPNSQNLGRDYEL